MIIRSVLLFLSRQQMLRRWVENSRVARSQTRRFIAGRSLEEGLAVVARLNSEGLLATLDHLGENVLSIEEGARTRDTYLAALRQISDLRLNATVSIKLTHFGLDFSEERCLDFVEEVVAEAARRGNSVEVDMESLNYVDVTLRAVSRFHERHRSVRAVIQAYLRRSEDDIQSLSARRIPVRLCKGAYKESDKVAFQTKEEIDENYLRLARLLLSEGVHPAMATHDERIIRQIVDTVKAGGIPRGELEFQMLFGIRNPLQRELSREGFPVRLYVPYGDAWYPYFMRRLAERPANLLLVLRSLFQS